MRWTLQLQKKLHYQELHIVIVELQYLSWHFELQAFIEWMKYVCALRSSRVESNIKQIICSQRTASSTVLFLEYVNHLPQNFKDWSTPCWLSENMVNRKHKHAMTLTMVLCAFMTFHEFSWHLLPRDYQVFPSLDPAVALHTRVVRHIPQEVKVVQFDISSYGLPSLYEEWMSALLALRVMLQVVRKQALLRPLPRQHVLHHRPQLHGSWAYQGWMNTRLTICIASHIWYMCGGQHRKEQIQIQFCNVTIKCRMNRIGLSICIIFRIRNSPCSCTRCENICSRIGNFHIQVRFLICPDMWQMKYMFDNYSFI